jgi:hypothetical protein
VAARRLRELLQLAQIVQSHRLDQHAGRVGGEGRRFRLAAVLAGQHVDGQRRNTGGHFASADLGGGLVAIQHGHLAIHQHGIVGGGGELVGSLAYLTLFFRVRGDVGLKHTETAHCDS